MLIPLREIKPVIDMGSIGIQVLPDYQYFHPLTLSLKLEAERAMGASFLYSDVPGKL